MSIANKVFAAREQAKNKPEVMSGSGDDRYSFLNPTNNMQAIQLALYEKFKDAACIGGGYIIELDSYYVNGSVNTPSEYCDILRQHPLYAEWFPEFEECMKTNNSYISYLEYVDDKIVLTFSDNSSTVTIIDSLPNIINDRFNEIKNEIECNFMNNIDDNLTTVTLELNEVPMISSEPEIALTTTPILNKAYAEFQEWLDNNGLKVSKFESLNTVYLTSLELTIEIVV